MTYHILTGILLFLSFQACSSKSEKQDNDKSSNNFDRNVYNYSEEESDEDNEDYSSISGCEFEDGTHSATVDYYNPETGYSQKYTLDVEVEDCEVVQINFTNGGWLDNDHITPAELDDEGNCTIYGEDGKTYDIQIDN